MIAVAQVAVRVVQSFMLPSTQVLYSDSSGSVPFVGFTQPGLFFTEFKWLIGEKIRPRTSSASANGYWQRFSQLYGAPCHNAFITAARTRPTLGDRRHHMLRFNCRKKAAVKKDVSNGLVMGVQPRLKEMKRSIALSLI